jgi:serine/threonine protein kinase
MQDVLEVPSSGLRGLGSAPYGRLIAGRYRLWSLLGRGGMGLVWLAQDELLDRPIALKQVGVGDAASEDSRRKARARALGEARAAARVNHDGVIKIHDVVRDDALPWIVMELLSGRTLAETLQGEGPLPIDEVAHIGLRLLDGLQAVHRAGIVHRDVKPGNVHQCGDGRVVLTDFGIAYIAGEEPRCPMDTFAGSPAYISPEQLHGAQPEPASDLFSLGATLFAAVEGRPPFDKGDVWATLISVIDDGPAPFVRAGPLRPVLQGLLAKEPERRLTGDDARDALLDIQRRSRVRTATAPRSRYR